MPLLEGDVFLWNGFNAVNSERQLGEVMGPIPQSKMRDYLLDAGVDDEDEREDIYYIWGQMDGVMREHYAGKVKAEREAIKAKAGRRR